jgi:hypothetical protein
MGSNKVPSLEFSIPNNDKKSIVVALQDIFYFQPTVHHRMGSM